MFSDPEELDEAGPEVHGPFERVLRGGVSEKVPRALARFFEGAGLERAASEPGLAGVIPIQADAEGLRYGDSLAGLAPLFDQRSSLPQRLNALAAVSLRLESLHAGGRFHGDLRPDTIWANHERVELLSASAPLDGPGLLRARLVAGAHPASVGFVAPEVISGAPVSAASDVYSLAALVVWVLSGRIPLGQFDLRPIVAGLGRGLEQTLTDALSPAPEVRPSLARICDALERVTDPDLGIRPDVPARPRGAGEAAPRAAAAAGGGAPKISGLLALVLSLGSAFVFCGLLGVVLKTWAGMGTGVQGILLAIITAGTAGLGLLLERRGFGGSGLGLLVLSTQLIWVNGLHLINAIGADRDEGAYLALGLAVSCAAVLLALRRQSMLAGGLATAATSVSAIALGALISSGTRFGGVFYTAGVAVAFAAIAFVGGLLSERKRTLQIPYAVGSLLWITASTLWATGLSVDRASGLDLAWPYAVILLLGLAAFRLQGPVATLAGATASLISVSVPLAHAGIAADRGSRHALLIYAAVIGLCFAAAAFLAGTLGAGEEGAPEPEEPGRRRGGRRPARPKSPRSALVGAWTVIGLLWFGISALAALAISVDTGPGVIDVAWPYVLAGGFLCASLLSKRAAIPATAGLCVLLIVVPSAHAAIAELSFLSLLWVNALGLGLLALAFRWERIASSGSLSLGAIGVGLLNVLLMPGLACLTRCGDQDGLKLVEEALGQAGNFNETTLVYLSMPMGTSLGLVGLGFLFSRDAARKLPYRILEAAGLLNAFVLLTLLSLPDVKGDVFFIGLLLLFGFVAVAVGVFARRAMYVTIASVALILNLFVQYFAKLIAAGVPWGFLAVGFGVALLVLAILYERKIKGFLPQLREWS